MSSNATNTDIANAIKELDLTVLGNVTYERHYHNTSSTCYHSAEICGGYVPVSNNTNDCIYDGDTPVYRYGYCSKCGARVIAWHKDQGNLSCTNSIPAYYTCGYSNGEIIKAIITY